MTKKAKKVTDLRCPYCHGPVQRLGEDAIDWCPEHGVLEGER